MLESSHTREAFEKLVEPQLAALLRLARRLAREPEDAEDLVQEACLKAYRAFHQFQLGSDSKVTTRYCGAMVTIFAVLCQIYA